VKTLLYVKKIGINKSFPCMIGSISIVEYG